MHALMLRPSLFAALISASLCACGGPELSGSSSNGGSGGDTGGTTSSSSSTAGGGGGGTGGSDTGGTTTTSTTAQLTLDDYLNLLRGDLDAAMLQLSADPGWPVPLDNGYLVVNTDPSLDKVAGDFDGWTGTDLLQDQGFSYRVLNVTTDVHYKFTNLTDWVADPWARSYTYDENGEMSLIRPSFKHIDRYFAIGDATLEPRTLRILIPAEQPTHVLYTHDGQNLFDPNAFFGGWKIQDTAPPGMMVVGIDNTPARMDEYTHVKDVIGGGGAIGGLGDAYADFLEDTVRPLVKSRYGEPPKVGTMGSSLGGLISFHIADRYPGEYEFAASLSGTMGWGSIGANTHNETMIERYQAHGHQGTVLYLDSGGDGGNCGDTDSDGIDDDIDQGDNYCENLQMYNVLKSVGYQDGTDLAYVFALGAQHNEAEWAARVDVPMSIFAGL